MKWAKVMLKGWQAFRTTGIAGVVAVLATYALVTAYPDLAIREDAIFTTLALISAAVGGSVANWMKHRNTPPLTTSSPTPDPPRAVRVKYPPKF